MACGAAMAQDRSIHLMPPGTVVGTPGIAPGVGSKIENHASLAAIVEIEGRIMRYVTSDGGLEESAHRIARRQ